jgi:hypothetical protein
MLNANIVQNIIIKGIDVDAKGDNGKMLLHCI